MLSIFQMANYTEVNPAKELEPKIADYNPDKFLNNAGYNLAIGLLISIGLVILFAAIFSWVLPTEPQNLTTDLEAICEQCDDTKRIEIVQLYFSELENQREFVLDIVKSVLINVLLPIMTAVLGYLFASRSGSPLNDTNSETV